MQARAIGWYPGHMARAMRRVGEDLRAVDTVIEAVDGRLPFSGANPALVRMAGRKARLLVLTRADLADRASTARWLEHFQAQGREAIAIDAKRQSDGSRLQTELRRLSAGRTSSRAMVVGIPNAGKSTLINAIARKNIARTENRAGVTRAQQWFRLASGLELLDTAGILFPKIDSVDAQWKLALIGAVPQARFDPEDAIARFVQWCAAHGRKGIPDLETFSQSRGFLGRGTLVDTHNAAWSYIKELNAGTFGPISLEEPPA